MAAGQLESGFGRSPNSIFGCNKTLLPWVYFQDYPLPFGPAA